MFDLIMTEIESDKKVLSFHRLLTESEGDAYFMEYVVETEKEIVQNYIIKSKQERIEWELSHSKKR